MGCLAAGRSGPTSAPSSGPLMRPTSVSDSGIYAYFDGSPTGNESDRLGSVDVHLPGGRHQQRPLLRLHEGDRAIVAPSQSATSDSHPAGAGK